MPLPILIPQTSSQKNFSQFKDQMERGSASNMQNDMGTVVRASQHVDMDPVSSGNQHALRCPEVDSVVVLCSTTQ